LFDKNPHEQYGMTVMDEELKGAMHGWAGLRLLGYLVAKEAV
jgi:hypothetical protein